MTRLVLTQSEVGTWLDCEMRAALRYEAHLSTEDAPGGARAGGTAGHAALLGGYRAWGSLGPVAGPTQALRAFREGMRDAFEAHRDEVLTRAGGQFGETEDTREAREVLDRVWEGLVLYADEIAARDVEESFPFAVEQPFEVPVLSRSGEDRFGVSLRGVIDLGLVSRRWGSVTVRDHKFLTTGQADTYDTRFALDLQLRSYLYAFGILLPNREPPRVAEFAVVTQFGPSVPITNKDGSISTAKIATTRAAYEAACETQVISWMEDPKDPEKAQARFEELRAKQRRVAESLPETLARWCSLHEHVYSDRDIDGARETIYQVARRVRLMRRGELAPVKNSRSCSILRCDFAGPCQLGNEPGEIVEMANGSGFVVRDERHVEVEGEPWRPGVKVDLLSVPEHARMPASHH